MQIIQNIREKGAAIVIALIALSLIAFILMDARQGSSRLFSASANSIGEVDGQDINREEFMNTVKQQQEQYGQQGSSMTYQIRQNVWEQMVAKIIFTEEFNKLGLSFAPKEMVSILLSDDPANMVRQYFVDKETGRFDADKAQEWWSQMKRAKADQKAAVEQQVIEPMKIQMMYNKYNSLLAASAYYPAWLQQVEDNNNRKFANVSYVAVPYNIINDSTVKVSDGEIMDYVKNHAATYKQEAGRYLSYISFNASASAADTANIVKSLDDLKQSFAADTNARLFLQRNPSSIDFTDTYVPKNKIAASQKDSIIALGAGRVFGPYVDGNNIVLAKMIGERELPDSVKCRHILIGTIDPQSGQPTLDDSTAKKRVDSIATAIKNGASFDSLVIKYSDDPGSKTKKGEYTFSAGDFGSLKKEFAEAIFYGKTGDKKIVHTDYGWHYIEILQQQNPVPAYKIAYLGREILPSQETINNANTQATRLAGEAQDKKSLDAYIAKNGLQKVDVPFMIKSSDYQLGALQDARDVIRWAFDAKEGQVSEPYNVGDLYIVAVVDKIQKEGLPDAATARPLVERLVRNHKKAEQIAGKLGTTLESAASAYGKTVETAGADSTLTFNAQIINGIGQEPKVIGAAFYKEFIQKVSSPIEGISGVYVIKVNEIGEKAAPAPEAVAMQRQQRQTFLQQEFSSWFEALKKQASIKDNRNKSL